MARNNLNRFLGNLKRYKKAIDVEKIYTIVGNVGEDIAKEEYSNSGVSPNSISHTVDNNTVEIIASGEHLAFTEFGTGVVGEGSYQGNLPNASMKLQFESPKGVQQSTDGWEYNYRAKQSKEKGETIKDWKGFPAKAQMFNTSQRLQNELGENIRKFVKGE